MEFNNQRFGSLSPRWLGFELEPILRLKSNIGNVSLRVLGFSFVSIFSPRLDTHRHLQRYSKVEGQTREPGVIPTQVKLLRKSGSIKNGK
jgi:hypothetical protein